jgi:hypothetical protein
MKTFQQVEKLAGVRLKNNLTNPRVVTIEDWIFPKDSILFTTSMLSSESSILKDYRCKVYIKPTINLSKSIGRYRKKPTTINRLINERKRLDKGFKFLHKFEEIKLVAKNRLGVVDYSELEDIIKYQKYPAVEYDKFFNLYTTIALDLKKIDKENKDIFLLIDLPNKFPSVTEVKQLFRFSGKRLLDKIEDKKFLVILELVKLITEHRKESLFNIYDNFSGSRINLLFRHNGKVTFFNLRKFVSLGLENDEVDPKLPKYNENRAIRSFFKYLALIILKSPDSIDELNRTIDISNKINDDSDDITNKDVDELLDLVHKQSETVEIVEDDEIATDIKLDNQDPVEAGKESLEILNRDNLITEKRKKVLEEALEESNKNLIKVSEEELKLETIEIPDIDMVLDKNALKDTVTPFDKQYISKVLPKHLNNTLLHSNNVGIPVTEHTITTEDTIVNRMEKHKITLQLPSGNSKSIDIFLPPPDENGYMLINGKQYRMRKQILDIPLKKINRTVVSIMSYSGKIFVNKAIYKKHDVGYKIYKLLLKNSMDETSNIGMLAVGDSNIYDKKLPLVYTQIGRYVRSVTSGEYYFLFDYLSRESLLDGLDIKISDIEKYGTVIGNDNDGNILLIKDEDISIYNIKDKKIYPLDNIFNILEIDKNQLPIEHITIKIMGKHIPIGLVLILFNGLKSVTNHIGVKYHTTNDNVKSDENWIVIPFDDTKLVIERTIDSELIFGGLVYIKDLKELSFKAFKSISGIKDAFFLMGLSDRYVTDLLFMKNAFIDSMTADTLRELKLPTTLNGLLFKAVEMLRDDNYKNPNHISTFMIKGYERLIGMLHHILYTNLRDYNRKLGKVTPTINISPYEIFNYLNADSTFMLVDDINPLKQISQKEEFTMTGMFGRTKDTVTMKDRVMDPSAVGIISEATKDSSDVGVTAYLSASPNLSNLSGVLSEAEEIGGHNIFSGPGNLAPFLEHDDGKRALYKSIQDMSVIPTYGQSVLPLITGYEFIIPYKVDDKYAMHAKEKGIVTKVNKKSITIKYNSGKEETYRLNTWFSSDVGGISYKHTLATLLEKGMKIDVGDNIYYDTAFFGPISLVKNRVAYKVGKLVKVFYTEDSYVYEDSSAISKHLVKELSTKISAVRPKILTDAEQVFNIAKIGSYVKYNDVLLTIAPRDAEVESNLSDDSKSILEQINRLNLKAETKGKVQNIEVFYNCNKEDLHPSLQELIKESDKNLKLKTGHTGQVDNKFSYKGKPLAEGELLIIFYIEKELKMLMGDKFSIANQLKTTIGKVYNKIVSESGVELDMEFGETSDAARIVMSPPLMGLINRILRESRSRVVELYKK